MLVYSEEEVREWGHLPGTALYWALVQGKVLHEAAVLAFSSISFRKTHELQELMDLLKDAVFTLRVR